ncbi:MAG: UDP-3-O-acyl-N-acetylglucosamine deacetylase [Alphaproteobacteria bacterium]|nr:UDP-3-O-acyl-N-acetylglucosamine deacetylase [Alphaproteobacteria bacterium]
MQHTIKNTITITGIGLHSGATVNMRLVPAMADHGIVFVRTDRTGDNVIPARWDFVVDTRLCTVIGNAAGATVGTIEHLMAALRGCGIDNIRVEIDAPEVPVMDGSSAPFVEKIDEVGIQVQAAPRRAIKILQEVVVEEAGKRVRLSPGRGSQFAGQIDFHHPVIGNQFYETRLVNGNFRHELSNARTFGFLEEVEALRAAGLARGGSTDNAIVLDQGRVLNEGGLRFSDEFIRHKLLDAVGDLFLAGGPILGAYEGFRAGHALNNAILHKLFTTKGAWKPVDLFMDEETETQDKILIATSRAGAVAIA